MPDRLQTPRSVRPPGHTGQTAWTHRSDRSVQVTANFGRQQGQSQNRAEQGREARRRVRRRSQGCRGARQKLGAKARRRPGLEPVCVSTMWGAPKAKSMAVRALAAWSGCVPLGRSTESPYGGWSRRERDIATVDASTWVKARRRLACTRGLSALAETAAQRQSNARAWILGKPRPRRRARGTTVAELAVACQRLARD